MIFRIESKILVFSLMIFSIFLLWGCEDQTNQEWTFDPNQNDTLRVMYYDEKFFMDTFGQFFMTKYPNINLEVISLPKVKTKEDMADTYIRFINENQPDILFLPNLELFKYFAHNDLLVALDKLIKKDNVNMDGYHSGVIDTLSVNKSLYGLSPTFDKRVLFYNKDLFDQNNIDYPDHQMHWQDLVDLAQEFPFNENLVGIYIDNYRNHFDLIKEIGTLEKLPMLNDDGNRLLINNKEWRNIFNFVINNYRSGVLINRIADGSIRNAPNDFLEGNAAMSIAPSGFINTLLRYSKINWGVVTEPVGKEPTKSYSINMLETFAININTEKKGPSWELLKYINSSEMAEYLSNSGRGLAPLSREKHFKSHQNNDLSAFYILQEKLDLLVENTTKDLFEQLSELAEEELKQAIESEKSIDEILDIIQKKGRKILDE